MKIIPFRSDKNDQTYVTKEEWASASFARATKLPRASKESPLKEWWLEQQEKERLERAGK